MASTFETLILNVDESGICTLTINRPDKLNALNRKVFSDLELALDDIQANDDIKALVITGSGDKAFVAGADIKELNSLGEKEAIEGSVAGQATFQRIEDLAIPVIAAVNGYALGGGCELAMACHLRIASKNAMLGLPEVSLGLIPGYGGTQRLPELVGKAKALEMIMTGSYVNAEEAQTIGLVNYVAEPVVEEAKKLAAKIIKQGPLAIKHAIIAIRESGKEDGFATEAKLFGVLYNTDDFKEGTDAFLEKRKPNFQGK